MLHAESQKVVDETFALYKDGGEVVPDTLHDRTILHIYSAHDTMEPDGTLNGYYQNLFFKLIVFNIHGKINKVYRPQRFYDAIFLDDNVQIKTISVFKDGATCIEIRGDVKFLDGQACTFYKEK